MYPNAQLEDTIGHTFRNLTNINAKLKKKNSMLNMQLTLGAF